LASYFEIKKKKLIKREKKYKCKKRKLWILSNFYGYFIKKQNTICLLGYIHDIYFFNFNIRFCLKFYAKNNILTITLL